MTSTPPRPQVFVGAASEREDLANGLVSVLNQTRELKVRLWRDFFSDCLREDPNLTTIEVLVRAAGVCDFGAFILSSDDDTVLRGRQQKTTRGNVLFEVGLFLGNLGRERTFLLVGDDFATDHPTDFGGVNFGTWSVNDEQDKSFEAAVRQTATRWRGAMVEKGLREAVHDADNGQRTAASNINRNRVPDGGIGPVVPGNGWLLAARGNALPRCAAEQLHVGAFVVHDPYGLGRVTQTGVQIDGIWIATVQFAEQTVSTEVEIERLYLVPRY